MFHGDTPKDLARIRPLATLMTRSYFSFRVPTPSTVRQAQKALATCSLPHTFLKAGQWGLVIAEAELELDDLENGICDPLSVVKIDPLPFIPKRPEFTDHLLLTMKSGQRGALDYRLEPSFGDWSLMDLDAYESRVSWLLSLPPHPRGNFGTVRDLVQPMGIKVEPFEEL